MESPLISIGVRGGKRRGLTTIEKSFVVAIRNEIDERFLEHFTQVVHLLILQEILILLSLIKYYQIVVSKDINLPLIIRLE
jgi:hypothetical protein